ncbi:MAG: signal transduction histidine kinase (STHK), LytS [Chloroflexota bacterium]|nr:MAG: signal transduction histidine kinase (STHK), LytS [Chloroflexota bacterium]
MATIAGLFERYEDANNALKKLNELGYGKDRISVIATQESIKNKLEGEEGSAAETATTGAVVGGLAGLLVGVGTLLIPGIGPVLSVGSLATLLGATATGAGIGAAAGGLRGALAEMDVPEAEATLYTESLKKGGILITVIAEGEQGKQVKRVMDENNAVDMKTRLSLWEKGGVKDDPGEGGEEGRK